MRIGILTEFPSPSVLSGPAIQTQFLKRGLEKRGHETVLMGPRLETNARSDQSAHQYPSVPWPTHPKVRVALPGPSFSHLWNPPNVDLIHAQTNTLMSDYANWIRRMWQVPVLNTHTIHMPTHSHFVLSDALYASPLVREQCRRAAKGAELRFSRVYNQGDCLIVQNRFYVDYWRDRGVTVPIEVVGRPIDPERFDVPPGPDPYPADFKVGMRFLVVCRHDREKRLEHLINIFSERILPHAPDVSLTLIGDGHEHEKLKALAHASSSAPRLHFVGEVPHEALVGWYRHADVFAYTSLSETFGNVINEALWCGLPVVALDDKMGVAHQLEPGDNGLLINPGTATTDSDFADACLALVEQPERRKHLSSYAAARARDVSHPNLIISRFEAIYARAFEHCKATLPRPLITANRGAQMKAFAFHMSRWAWGHATLLGLAYTAAHIGAGRSPGDRAALTPKQSQVRPH